MQNYNKLYGQMTKHTYTYIHLYEYMHDIRIHDKF
jgi:hypothetical protein